MALIKVTASYKAGAYPGTVYNGKKTFEMNVDNNQHLDVVTKLAGDRAKYIVAKETCFAMSMVTIKDVSVQYISNGDY